jgi:Tfp pilus tip-associated adhesin PilY1
VDGETGQELWSFIAPEHHAKLKRLHANTPTINYPNIAALPGAVRKDYFFDGSTGLYQKGDNSKIWIYPAQRRGGRMIYAFDVTTKAGPGVLKWLAGCPNLTDDTGCTTGMSGVGQTWSVPSVAFVKGYTVPSAAAPNPVVIVGGGYDNCEDTDAAVTTCVTPKGNKVYVFDALSTTNPQAPLATFTTLRSVAADVTLIDRDFDGKVDHAYVVDTGGNIYRIDFIDPINYTPRAAGAWTMTKIARTQSGNRKFLFGPSALSVGPQKVYLALGTGDRERPLITNYPYVSSVQNRFYSFIDDFTDHGVNGIDLDGSSMQDVSTGSDCSSTLGSGKIGWFMNLEAGRGEQTVTSSVIFGGTVFFSTNRPISSPPGSCAVNLGEARGYAVNLLNASGVIGTGELCGGGRSGVFTGGGIPPSPVVGTVPVDVPGGGTKSINVLIGGIDLKTGGGSPIGAQQPPVPIRQVRSRLFWYPGGER